MVAARQPNRSQFVEVLTLPLDGNWPGRTVMLVTPTTRMPYIWRQGLAGYAWVQIAQPGPAGPAGPQGNPGSNGQSVTVFTQPTQPTANRVGDIWIKP